VIRIDVHTRLVRAALKLGGETVAGVEEKLALVAEHFGDPHRHGGLGLRKLGRRSYEARLDRDWRIVFIKEVDRLTAYDLMSHDQVRKWLKTRKGD
jgi:hypothetical protein